MNFIDLKAQYNHLKIQIDSAIMGVLGSGSYIMGGRVLDLEKRLAEYTGRAHCISCSNGTNALIMALYVYGIGKGDAVFVPDFTFFASGEAVALLGATPVFVDVDADTFNICPEQLEKAVMQVKKEGKLNPRAVMPVDLFGQTADYEAVLNIAEKHSLLVIEDAAQGFGGTYNGKRACSFGDISATSFFPAKPLGCYGDGGAIFTDDEKIAELLRSIRAHGSGKNKYDNVRLGINARLDTIQAAILHCKLDVFDEELIARQKWAGEYESRLSGVIKTPGLKKGFTSSWAQYTLTAESEQKRDEIMKKLKEAGIPTMIYYAKPMHLQTAFDYLGGREGDFPVSEALSKKCFSIPMHPYLEAHEADTVCRALIDNI